MTAARADRTAHSGAHNRRRRELAPLVAAGVVACWRCGQLIKPGEPWDLGHKTDHALGGSVADTAPEHRWPTGDCPGNRHAGGWRAATRARRRRATPSRNW